MAKYSWKKSFQMIARAVGISLGIRNQKRVNSRKAEAAKRQALAKKVNPKMDAVQDGFQDVVFGGYPVYEQAKRPPTIVRSKDYRKKHPHPYSGSRKTSTKRRR